MMNEAVESRLYVCRALLFKDIVIKALVQLNEKNNRFLHRVETEKLVFGSSRRRDSKTAFRSRLDAETDFLDTIPGFRASISTSFFQVEIFALS